MFVEVLPQVAETFKAPENSQFLNMIEKQPGGWGIFGSGIRTVDAKNASNKERFK